MINGSHVVIYSSDSEADRAFFRDVLSLKHVDVGRGWLIFALPPSEVAVHPDEGGGGSVEFYLMCADVDRFVRDMTTHGVACAAIQDQPWGRLTQITLPGGGRLGVYEPKHERP